MSDENNRKKRKRDAKSSKTAVRKRKRNDKAPRNVNDIVIDVPEQSRDVEDQDEEFFQGDEVGDFSFLRSLDPTELGKRVQKEKLPRQEKPAKIKAAKDDVEDEYSDEAELSEAISEELNSGNLDESNWEAEQPYEQQPRAGNSQWRKKESTKLPVRSASGKLLQMAASESESESESESLDETEESDIESNVEGPYERSAVENSIIVGQEAVVDAKETLAKLAEEIIESPEEKVSHLKSFRELFNKGNMTIKKLALVTQLTVYKDIIPGYRIRPLTETEKAAKVSKDVKAVRAFEESILSNYKSFLSSLVSIIKSARTDELLRPLSTVAVTCATSLLIAVPHFNYRTDLLKIIIGQLSRRTPDDTFIKCHEALETLFKDDEEGRAALEAVSMVSKMAKARNFKVHQSLIQSLLHLRLLTELDVKASMDHVEARIKKKDRVFRTKKERKAFKENKKIERDLAEADAQVSVEERERLQSETLKIVFSLYFRILKDTNDNAMLSVVLDGIAKFARLINAEFFGDLLEALREILERWDDEEITGSGDQSRVREELVCINTAFALLANQGGSNIDLSFFIERFYEVLSDISLSTALLNKPSSEERPLMELIVRIVDAILFSSPTAPSPARISLFYKRILTCSLQMEEKEATMFLKLLQRINGRFGKKVEGMWDREGAGVGTVETGRGVRGWELALLGHHYGSGVTQISKALCKSEA